MLVPKRSFIFFYSKIRNFTVAPKRPFVFYSEIKNLELYHSFFDYEIRNMKVVSKLPFVVLTTKYKI